MIISQIKETTALFLWGRGRTFYVTIGQYRYKRKDGSRYEYVSASM